MFETIRVHLAALSDRLSRDDPFAEMDAEYVETIEIEIDYDIGATCRFTAEFKTPVADDEWRDLLAGDLTREDIGAWHPSDIRTDD